MRYLLLIITFLLTTLFVNGQEEAQKAFSEGLAIKYNPNYMEAYANSGVQKINKIPTSEKLGKNIDCLEDPCADLLKANKMRGQKRGRYDLLIL